MRLLTTALYTYTVADAVASGFMTSIGSRFYDTEAPQGATFPYCVYLIVTDTPEWTWSEDFEDVLIQFSIFSATRSSLEADDIYTKLDDLYHKCSLGSIDGGKQFIWMWRNILTRMKDEITTKRGTVGVWHLAVDFNVFYEIPFVTPV